MVQFKIVWIAFYLFLYIFVLVRCCLLKQWQFVCAREWFLNDHWEKKIAYKNAAIFFDAFFYEEKPQPFLFCYLSRLWQRISHFRSFFSTVFDADFVLSFFGTFIIGKTTVSVAFGFYEVVWKFEKLCSLFVVANNKMPLFLIKIESENLLFGRWSAVHSLLQPQWKLFYVRKYVKQCENCAT